MGRDGTPRVVVVGQGGTIAMRAASEGGAVPALSPAELVGAVPQLAHTGISVDAVGCTNGPAPG